MGGIQSAIPLVNKGKGVLDYLLSTRKSVLLIMEPAWTEAMWNGGCNKEGNWSGLIKSCSCSLAYTLTAGLSKKEYNLHFYIFLHPNTWSSMTHHGLRSTALDHLVRKMKLNLEIFCLFVQALIQHKYEIMEPD